MEAPGLVPGRHSDDSVFSYEISPWDTLGGTHIQATGSICAGVGGLAGNISDTQVVPQHQPGPCALWSEPSSSGHPQAQHLAQVVRPLRAQGCSQRWWRRRHQHQGTSRWINGKDLIWKTETQM